MPAQVAQVHPLAGIVFAGRWITGERQTMLAQRFHSVFPGTQARLAAVEILQELQLTAIGGNQA